MLLDANNRVKIIDFGAADLIPTCGIDVVAEDRPWKPGYKPPEVRTPCPLPFTALVASAYCCGIVTRVVACVDVCAQLEACRPTTLDGKPRVSPAKADVWACGIILSVLLLHCKQPHSDTMGRFHCSPLWRGACRVVPVKAVERSVDGDTNMQWMRENAKSPADLLEFFRGARKSGALKRAP